MGHIDELPTELLVEIFRLVRDEHWLSWTQVMGVCRRWRDVAWSTPSLWTTLRAHKRFSEPQVLDKFLRRSGSLNLDVTLRVNPAYCDTLLNAILPHRNRLRALTLFFVRWKVPLVQKVLNSVAGPIRDLSLCCASSPAPMIPISAVAFPSLRSLRTDAILPAPRSATFRFDGVTRLHVSNVSRLARPDPLAPLEYHLLNTLAAFPDLEELELKDALPSIWQVEGIPTNMVVLEKLRTLRLEDSIRDIQLFLGHITIPTSASLEVVAHLTGLAWVPFGDGGFLSILPENHETTLPMVKQATVLRLLAGHMEGGGVELIGSSEGTCPWSVTIKSPKTLLKSFIACALSDIPDLAYDLPDLEELEVHVSPYVPFVDCSWEETLDELPMLRKLVVGGLSNAQDLVDGLYEGQYGVLGLEELELCLERPPIAVAEKLYLRCERGRVPRGVENVVMKLPPHVEDVPPYQKTMFSTMVVPLDFKVVHGYCPACHACQ
ncbi:hypothetical protein OH77DRAFT_619263 [Trametes cingulata]|nr:hypothetical protein OH77DRAFT_619263 [Trametes cingulata]